MDLVLFGLFLFLSCYCTGNMVTLQIQHYGIYPHVGKGTFKNYMQVNNKAALVPSIIPGMLLLLLSIVMMFYRPAFMPFEVASASLVLNLVAFASTFVWQRKLQSEMAVNGYDDAKLKLLNTTNWIRVVAYLLLSFVSVYVVMNALLVMYPQT